MQLMMKAYMTSLSQHRQIILISASKLHFSKGYLCSRYHFQALTMLRRVMDEIPLLWLEAFLIILSKFPHFWVCIFYQLYNIYLRKNNWGQHKRQAGIFTIR